MYIDVELKIVSVAFGSDVFPGRILNGQRIDLEPAESISQTGLDGITVTGFLPGIVEWHSGDVEALNISDFFEITDTSKNLLLSGVVIAHNFSPRKNEYGNVIFQYLPK